MNKQSVIIANIFEFNRQTMSNDFIEAEYLLWRQAGIELADMCLFWCGDDKLVITPYPLEKNFISDVCNILHYRNVQVISPARVSDSICEDIMADSDLYALLVDTLRNSNDPQIISWGATKELYALLDRLKKEGVKFRAPEVPERDNYWTVRYLDSKSGFRDLFTSLSMTEQLIRIPDGYICTDMDIALQVANSLTSKNIGIVIKADNSVGGKGVLIFRPGSVKPQYVEAHILTSVRLTPLLSSGLVIVEEFIESQIGLDIASPSIQAIVDEYGQAKVTGLGGQIINSDGTYMGAIIGQKILPASLTTDLNSIAKIVGREISAIGYRGIFNLDTLFGADGHLYCVELNARRTSVTYILDLIAHMFGVSNPDTVTIITNERFSSKELHDCTYDKARSSLLEIQFPLKNQFRGVFITIPTSLNHFVRTPKLGFIVIGVDPVDAHALYKQASQLLGSKES